VSFRLSPLMHISRVPRSFFFFFFSIIWGMWLLSSSPVLQPVDPTSGHATYVSFAQPSPLILLFCAGTPRLCSARKDPYPAPPPEYLSPSATASFPPPDIPLLLSPLEKKFVRPSSRAIHILGRPWNEESLCPNGCFFLMLRTPTPLNGRFFFSRSCFPPTSAQF